MYAEQSFLVIYAIIWCVSTLIFWLKNRKFNVTLFILFWLCLSAISSSFFYFFYSPILPKLSLEAIPYFAFGLVLMLIPLLSFRQEQVSNIEIKPYISIIALSSTVFGVVSLLPLLENIYYSITHPVLNSFQDAHALTNDGESIGNLSFIGLKLNNFVSHFSDTFGLCLCVLLTERKKYKKNIIWLFIAIFELVLQGMICGGRVTAFYQFFTIILPYILLYRFYKKADRLLYNKTGMIVVGCLATVLIVSSIFKFEGKDTTYVNVGENQVLFASNTVYFGEAPVRFAAYAWEQLKHNTNGHYMFDHIVRHIDGIVFESNIENRAWAENHAGLMYPQVFYGIPGFAYIDFGYTGGIVFLVLFAFFFHSRIKTIKGNIPVYRLIILVIYLKILVMSIMYFPYCNSKIQDLLYMYFFYLIIKKQTKSQRTINKFVNNN